MKGLTQKLLLSILTVVVTTIALGTTTFAWFTITNTARIQEFEAQVVGDSGIEVSFDKVAWYTTMSTSVVEEYLFNQAAKDPNTGYQGDGFRFDHVTTQDGLNFSGLELGSTAGRYLDFTLHFRSPNVQTLYLTDLTLTSPEQTSWTANVPFTQANGNAAVAGTSYSGFRAANGARISLVGTGSYPVIIYENSSANGNVVLGEHVNQPFAVETAVPDPIDPDNNPSTYLYSPVSGFEWLYNGAVSYYVANNDEAPAGFGSVNVPNTITNLNNMDGSDIENIGKAIATLTMDATTGYYEGSVRIRVWLEGWDPDTYNSILDGRIRLSFTFKDKLDLPVTP